MDVLPGKVRALAERRVIEIDPDAAARRSAKERADRHVRLVPAGADTALVDAYLPVEQATACWKALHEHAVEQHAPQAMPAALSHLMCDTFVERLTGAVRADQLKTEICVVMCDTTLLECRLPGQPSWSGSARSPGCWPAGWPPLAMPGCGGC